MTTEDGASADPLGAVRLDTPWIVWMTQALLDRVAPAEIIARLAAAEVPAEVALAEIERIRQSPPFAELAQKYRGAVTAQRVLAGVDQARGPIVVDTIDGAKTSDDAVFDAVKTAWSASRPLLLHRTFADVPAASWTFAALRERFGALDVEVNTKRSAQTRAALREKNSERIPFSALVDATSSESGDDLYLVSKNGLLQDKRFADLHRDLIRLPSFLNEETAGRRTSLWIGPKGTHTQPHFDPHNVVLLQVAGEKRVTLTRTAPKTLRKLDGYFANPAVLAEETRATNGASSVTVDLRQGDALFIPVATFHEVVATAPSMTLSFLGFAWPNNFHHVHPA